MNNFIYQGHITQKDFGQHFLHDNNVINDIISCINLKSNQAVIEIGPGLGALTKSIVQYVKKITVIEIDKNLVYKLKKDCLLQSRIDILKKDVLKINFFELYKKLGKPLKIIGNLPYNISTKIMIYLLKYIDVIEDMHFMLQSEVANRVVAKPNCKSYSRLSILIQYYCKTKKKIEIKPISFRPIPKVNSSIVSMVPHSFTPYLVDDIKRLNEITFLAFNQRRKMIKNSLKKFFSIEKFKKHNIDYTMRADAIDIQQYCNLAKIS